jgi:DNA-binding MarR family transcriptional regulator
LDRQQLLTSYTEKFIAHRRMWEAEWSRKDTIGLSSGQALMLMLLNLSGPQQAKDLIGNLAVSSGGVTSMADKLIDRGLLRRIKNQQDRRVVFFELTDEGRKLLKTVEQEWNHVMNTIFSVLSDAEVAILAHLFAKLVENKK